MEYLDFEVKLEPAGAGKYRVRVLNSPAGQAQLLLKIPGNLEDIHHLRNFLLQAIRSCDPLPLELRELAASQRMPRASTSSQQVGDLLFNMLFSGSTRQCYDESRGQCGALPRHGLRIKIHLDPTEPGIAQFHALPWEFLFRAETRDFLALDRSSSVVRYLDVQRPSLPLQFRPPLRIGVLSSRPRNLPSLNLSQEGQLIKDAWMTREDIKVSFLDASVSTLRRQILDREINILHFMGHGCFDSHSGVGSLIFEDNRGLACKLSGESFSNLLKGLESLRLVVLNACQTAASSSSEEVDTLAGVSSALMLAGMPAAIAMQLPISDAAAVEFSSALYASLARGESLDVAVTEGRLAIYALSSQSVEWATPVIFLRSPSGRLFEPEFTGTAQEVQHLSSKLLKGPPQTQHRESAPATARSFQALQKLSASEIQALLSSLRNAAAAESGDSPEVRVQLGLIYLYLKLFDAALSEFEQVAGIQPERSEAYYYSALASLRGRRPRLLPTSEVQRCEKLLETALQLDSESSKSFYLLGLLRYDHYFGNSLPSPLPTYDVLFRKAAGKPHDAEEIERLLHAVPVRNPDLLSLLRRQRGRR